jgi:hypothetical protein
MHQTAIGSVEQNQVTIKAFAVSVIVLVVFELGLGMGWHKDQLGARLRQTHTVLTSTIASPSQAPTASIVAASSPSNSAIERFVVRVDEKLTTLLELASAIRSCGELA